MAAKLQRTLFFLALVILLLATFFATPARAHNGEDHDEGHEEEEEEAVDLRDRGLILTKVYCLIVIFFATFIPGVSPYFLRWNSTFLILGIQFAGGVFLATAMLHFLADSNETFGDLTTKTYPFAFMLAVSGYLLTMLADVIAQFVFARQPVTDRRQTDVENSPTVASKVHKEPGESKSCCGQSAASCKCAEELAEPQEVRDVVKVTLIRKASLGDAVLLIFALCFHSVFEGIAIGVSGTGYEAWRNLWTISLHKVFAAIAMGIALLRMMPNRPLLSCASYAFAFGISSPIGVGIGIAIDSTTQGSTADWIYAISMGLATGIFIYVAINHLLAKGYVPLSKVKLDRPMFKLLALTLGCGLIFVVMIWD